MQAGATAVIGTHPHLVQPWHYPVAPDGSQGLVIYSTGNFVSGQMRMARRTGALAMLQLCRQPPPRDLANAVRSRLVLARAGWVPLVKTRTALGAEIEIAGENAKGLAADARALAARHLPAGNLLVDLDCEAPEGPREVLLALQ